MKVEAIAEIIQERFIDELEDKFELYRYEVSDKVGNSKKENNYSNGEFPSIMSFEKVNGTTNHFASVSMSEHAIGYVKIKLEDRLYEDVGYFNFEKLYLDSGIRIYLDVICSMPLDIYQGTPVIGENMKL